MKVYIIPRIIELYKNQFEYSVDIKLFKFLKFLNPKIDPEILLDKKKIIKKSCIFFSGGNNIKQFSKNPADTLRNNLDNYYFNFFKKNKKNLSLIGICHGAQFLANKFSLRNIFWM